MLISFRKHADLLRKYADPARGETDQNAGILFAS